MDRRRDSFHIDPHRSGRRTAVIATIGIAVLGALIFTSSYASEELSSDGLDAQRSEAVLGANALTLKALGQAVLLAEDHAFGVADAGVLADAVTEAQRTLSALDSAVAGLASHDAYSARVDPLLDDVHAAGTHTLDLIGTGDVQGAGNTLQAAQPAFEALRDAVVEIRDGRLAALGTSGRVSGQVGNVVRFLIAFLLPLGAILAYRYAAHRQLQMAEVQLDSRLEAEHEVVRAKDEFIANVSHELRTPLTSIYGFSALLLEQGFVDPNMARDMLVIINNESAELGRMVEDLLVSARAEAGVLGYSYAEVSPSVELESVIAPLRETRDGIETSLPDVTVWADSTRVRQILRNLISNAVTHGGEQIRVVGTTQGDRLVIAVEDDGAGVPADVEPRLFTRFVHQGTAALTEGSVGLGLAVVRGLCEAMSGGVRYERTSGWSRFIFWLPLASPDRKEPTTGRPVLTAPR